MKNPTAESYAALLLKQEYVLSRLNKISEDTVYSSNLSEQIDHPAFQELLQLGKQDGPYEYDTEDVNRAHLIDVIMRDMTPAGWPHILLLLRLENIEIPDDHAGDFISIIHDILGWYLKRRNAAASFEGLKSQAR